jgi:hypothetical protein
MSEIEKNISELRPNRLEIDRALDARALQSRQSKQAVVLALMDRYLLTFPIQVVPCSGALHIMAWRSRYTSRWNQAHRPRRIYPELCPRNRPGVISSPPRRTSFPPPCSRARLIAPPASSPSGCGTMAGAWGTSPYLQIQPAIILGTQQTPANKGPGIHQDCDWMKPRLRATNLGFLAVQTKSPKYHEKQVSRLIDRSTRHNLN